MNEPDKKFPANLDVFGIIGLRRKKRVRDKKYASFNRRMLASAVDSLLLLFAMPLFDRLAPIDRSAFQNYKIDSSDPLAVQHWMLHIFTDPAFVTSWFINLFVQIVAIWILSGVCWHYWSATPGKMLLRIKIVDADTEQHITDKQIIIRLLGYVVSTAALLGGFFWISYDKRHQAWHDKMAHTVVIVKPWKRDKDSV